MLSYIFCFAFCGLCISSSFISRKFILIISSSIFLLFFFFFFFGPHLWHMDVHRLGVEPELQLQDYATDAGHSHSHSNMGSGLHLLPTPQLVAMPDLNPLSGARDWICLLMDTSQVCNLLSHNLNSPLLHFFVFLSKSPIIQI